MSLFGEMTGVADEIRLVEDSNIEHREMLNWKRDLIGLYISDHPLSEHQAELAQFVTHFSAQLAEAQHEEKVRVAGLITSIRPYSTKAGKPMGFVTLEDIQGNIDLVLFPRTWAQFQPILETGKIVLVEGKVDTQSAPPKVLVDAIKTEFKYLVSTDAPLPSPAERSEAVRLKPRSTAESPRRTSLIPAVSAAPKAAPAARIAEPAPVLSPVRTAPPMEDWGEMPPPPDNFPEGWENEWQPSFENAQIAERPEAAHSAAPLSAAVPTKTVSQQPEAELRPTPVSETPEVQAVILPPTLYAPLAQADRDADHPPQQITVSLEPTGDSELDKRRIRAVYGTLIAFHGRDHFSFQIYEGGRPHLLDFPGVSTHICPALLERLKKVVGTENWRIEEIAFP